MTIFFLSYYYQLVANFSLIQQNLVRPFHRGSLPFCAVYLQCGSLSQVSAISNLSEVDKRLRARLCAIKSLGFTTH